VSILRLDDRSYLSVDNSSVSQYGRDERVLVMTDVTRTDYDTDWRSHTYDTAIPQEWYDSVYTRTGINPSGHIHWCYADSRTWGEPIATDAIGAAIMVKVAANPRNPLHYHHRD
jgi:hypothetical protein